jgi:ribonuclease-3
LAERVGLSASSELLVVATTHSSYAAEHDCASNERLEFLGDAVVDLAVADLIVTSYPELNEGAGSIVRAHVVNEAALAEAARDIDLAAAMRIGRGVAKEHGLERPSILADAFEAVVGALYLEAGYETAKSFVHAALAARVADAATRSGEVDPKTRLRQWFESAGLGVPVYETVADGPSHDVTFSTALRVGDVVAHGSGRSKKSAETQAAIAAWEVRPRA